MELGPVQPSRREQVLAIGRQLARRSLTCRWIICAAGSPQADRQASSLAATVRPRGSRSSIASAGMPARVLRTAVVQALGVPSARRAPQNETLGAADQQHWFLPEVGQAQPFHQSPPIVVIDAREHMSG